jgi:hypothetical protein
MSNKLKKMWKEAIVPQLEVFSTLPEGDEGNLDTG